MSAREDAGGFALRPHLPLRFPKTTCAALRLLMLTTAPIPAHCFSFRGIHRGRCPSTPSPLAVPKTNLRRAAAADVDHGANPRSLFLVSRDTSGALPLDPVSSCGAQNRHAPHSRLPVLTAAPAPARCFPHCGRSQALPFVKGGRKLSRGFCGGRLFQYIEVSGRESSADFFNLWKNRG